MFFSDHLPLNFQGLWLEVILGASIYVIFVSPVEDLGDYEDAAQWISYVPSRAPSNQTPSKTRLITFRLLPVDLRELDTMHE